MPSLTSTGKKNINNKIKMFYNASDIVMRYYSFMLLLHSCSAAVCHLGLLGFPLTVVQNVFLCVAVLIIFVFNLTHCVFILCLLLVLLYIWGGGGVVVVLEKQTSLEISRQMIEFICIGDAVG